MEMMISRAARVIGKKHFHVKYINLSYRIRGNDARIHTKIVAINIVIEISHKLFRNWIFPIKKVLVSRLIIKMLAYSAIKIRANVALLYSVLNPDTSSDSPSARSNGVRFVSAKFVINHKSAIGNRSSITHEVILMFMLFIFMEW
jgi:hypothetical protein